MNSFNNSKLILEPAGLRDEFEMIVESVSEFEVSRRSLPAPRREQLLVNRLLSGLLDTKVGLYSIFHENAMYYKGYKDPETIRLAFMSVHPIILRTGLISSY